MKTKVNGVKIAYDIHGIGVPVVLLHAFPLNRTMWEPQIEELSKDFQLITPDLRGFGESEGTNEPYLMELFAEDVYGLINYLGLEQVVLGGLSMGGYIAFAFYRNYPEKVQALILADTRAEADTEEGKKNRKALANQVIGEGTKVIAEQLAPKLLGKTTRENNRALLEKIKDIIRSNSMAAIANASLGMALRPDSNPILEKIQCPTLILVGEEDELTPVALAENMKQKIQDAELVVIPKAGHLSNIEQPQAFNRAVKKFLKNL